MYKRILIVDDEAFVRELLAELFSTAGYEVHTAGTAHETLHRLETTEFQVALVDLRVPGVVGLELIHQIKRLSRDISIVVMTAHPTVDTALEAMRLGVCDYVVKPFRLKEIECVMNDAVERHAERQQVRQLRERVSELEERLADLSRSDRRRKIRLARVAETSEFAVSAPALSAEVIDGDDEPAPRLSEAVRRAVVTTER